MSGRHEFQPVPVLLVDAGISDKPDSPYHAGAFNINYGNFSTSTGTGGFYVTGIGNDLMLDFSPGPPSPRRGP